MIDSETPDERGLVAVVLHEPIVGGSAVGLLRVLPALEARGWRFVFWVPPGPLQAELAGRGHDVAGEERLLRYSPAALREPPGTAARLRSAPGYLRRLRRWIVERAPDVVLANTLVSVPEAAVARTTGAPVALYVHEILPRDRRGRTAAALIRRTAHSVITNSTASLAALRAGGVEASMAHYGIELPPAPEPRDGGRVVVGTLGTVSRRKGSDVFVAAAERVLRERPDVELRMVGPVAEGPERRWAEELVVRARDLGITWRTTSDPFAELADWSVLVLPTRREPFGLVLIEAMAMELPVVSTRIDGPREIVTPDTGVLVDVDDDRALAASIVALAGDPERRARLGAAGRARVAREFTLDAQADAVERALVTARVRAGRIRSAPPGTASAAGSRPSARSG